MKNDTGPGESPQSSPWRLSLPEKAAKLIHNMDGRRIGQGLIAVTVAITLFFAWRLWGAFFVREDFTYIVFARWGMTNWLDFFTRSFSQDLWFRQFTILFWKICWLIFGFHPGVNYAVNAAVLLMTAIAGSRLARGFGASCVGAGLAAIMIVVHPVTIETSSYLATRGDLIGSLMALCALLAYRRSRTPETGAWWSWTAALSTLLACLSKEMFITVPLLVFLMPETGEGEKPFDAGARLRGSLPHLAAVAIFALWRAAVIGHLVGGYMNERSGTVGEILIIPINAAKTLIGAGKMLAGVTYESILFSHWKIAVVMAAVGMVGWIVMGREHLRRRTNLLLSAWIFVAIAPVLNLAKIIDVSPRLVFFPFVITSIWFASIFPKTVKPVYLVAPAAMLLAWLPLSDTIARTRVSEGEMHRKIVRAMMDYYMPRGLHEPENQYKIIFGLPPAMFTLDEMFDAAVPGTMDYIDTLPATFRFLFADRMNRVAFAKRPGSDITRDRYTSRWDFLDGERFNAFENDIIVIESWRPPDILGLIDAGKIVKVSDYDSEENTFSDLTDFFRRMAKTRRELAESAETIEYDFSMGMGPWTPGPQLVPNGNAEDAGSFVSTGNDPYMSTALDDMTGLGYSTLELDMRVTQTGILQPAVMLGTVSWESDTPPGFGLAKRVEFPVRADGTRHVYKVDLGGWPGWYLAGKLKSLRVDPADSKCKINIYSIRLVPYRPPVEIRESPRHGGAD